MSTAVGSATDYLYGLAQQSVTGVTVNGEPAVAVDGPPDDLTFGMFVVGLTDAPPEAAGDTTLDRIWNGLGGRRVEDTFDIPCYIDVRVPGRALKPARDIAEGIFNTFWTLFVADLTLGGALHGGRIAQVDKVTFTPNYAGTEGEPGRRLFIGFDVRCQHVTTT